LDANSLQQQVDEGIDAVIVDNVLAIRKGLTERASKDKVVSSTLGVADSIPFGIVQGSALTNGTNGNVGV
jgi:hypothetical protein